MPRTWESLKIAVVGAKNTGKTTFLNRIVEKDGDALPTIGVDYFYFNIQEQDSLKIPILCWDCSAEDKYRSLILDNFSPLTQGIFVFYDSFRDSTLEPCVSDWIRDMTLHRQTPPVVMIVSSKSDLSGDSAMMERTEKNALERGFLFESCSPHRDDTKGLQKIMSRMAKTILLREDQHYKRFCKDNIDINNYRNWMKDKGECLS